jgi:hypothetical protein
MLRSALALLSSLQVGIRIKQSIERSLRQAAVIAVAAVVLTAAAIFGLIAAYQVLILSYGFTAPEAAGIIGAALLLLGLLILATLPLFGDRVKRVAPRPAMTPADGLGMVDQSVGKAMQQVGPLTLLSIAFIAGILLSRRK